MPTGILPVSRNIDLFISHKIPARPYGSATKASAPIAARNAVTVHGIWIIVVPSSRHAAGSSSGSWIISSYCAAHVIPKRPAQKLRRAPKNDAQPKTRRPAPPRRNEAGLSRSFQDMRRVSRTHSSCSGMLRMTLESYNRTNNVKDKDIPGHFPGHFLGHELAEIRHSWTFLSPIRTFPDTRQQKTRRWNPVAGRVSLARVWRIRRPSQHLHS